MISQDKCSFCSYSCGNKWCDFSNNTIILKSFALDKTIIFQKYSPRVQKIIKDLVSLSNLEGKNFSFKFIEKPKTKKLNQFKKEKEKYIYTPKGVVHD